MPLHYSLCQSSVNMIRLPPVGTSGSFQTALHILSPVSYVMCESSRETTLKFVDALLENIESESLKEKFVEYVDFEFNTRVTNLHRVGCVCCRQMNE